MVTGPAIEAAGQQLAQFVSEAAKRQRVARDGSSFHLTLLPKGELPNGIEARDALLAEAAELCQHSRFICVGLGVQGQRDHAVWFAVIVWPAAQAFCRKHGRTGPIDLHVTLGFDRHDLHGVRKGSYQLEPLPLGLDERCRALPTWTAEEEHAVGGSWPLACSTLQEASASCSSVCGGPNEDEARAELLALTERLVEFAEQPQGTDPSAAKLAGHTAPAAIRAQLRSARSALLGKLGREREALEEAEVAAGLAPEQARPMVLAGASRLRLGSPDAALEWLRHAQALEGDGALALHERERVVQMIQTCENRRRKQGLG